MLALVSLMHSHPKLNYFRNGRKAILKRLRGRNHFPAPLMWSFLVMRYPAGKTQISENPRTVSMESHSNSQWGWAGLEIDASGLACAFAWGECLMIYFTAVLSSHGRVVSAQLFLLLFYLLKPFIIFLFGILSKTPRIKKKHLIFIFIKSAGSMYPEALGMANNCKIMEQNLWIEFTYEKWLMLTYNCNLKIAIQKL